MRQSYSIEAEDLMLETILSGPLKHHTTGTYIDIGSAHPIEHSNTYLFYQKGWRGLCVEPNPDLFPLYKELRPRDKALNIGISDGSSGPLQYHRFTQSLVNGFYGQDMIDRQKSLGETYLGSLAVPCLSVSDFLENEVFTPHVELLNIDVETMDARILGKWNWDMCRPKVICAEIHTETILTMLESDVATVMRGAGYTPMSRGWLSTIFVANELL